MRAMREGRRRYQGRHRVVRSAISGPQNDHQPKDCESFEIDLQLSVELTKWRRLGSQLLGRR